MTPNRGDLYFIDVPPEYRGEHEDFGPHMHVVVSRNEINALGKTVVVVPLTSPTYKDTGQPKNTGPYRKQRIRIPKEHKLWDENTPHKQDGDSLAKTEQMFCLSQSLLGERCGKLTETAMNSLEPGMCYVLNIPEINAAISAIQNAGKALRPPVKPRS